jgi:SAM-dependent methyltransferase
MAYLRWRRVLELGAVDRPWLGAFLRRPRPTSGDPTESWDSVYERGAYDRLPLSEQRHHHRLLAMLISEATPAARTLEIGCGEGIFYQSLKLCAPSAYLGVDVSRTAIARAHERFERDVAAGDVRFEVGDGRAFTPDEMFDVIAFPECIEYLGELQPLLAHYRQFLKPGGLFGVSMWMSGNSVRLWQTLKATIPVRDEATVLAPWGGAWIVATFDAQ